MFQFFFFFYFSLLLILWIEAVTNWVDVKPGVVLGTPEKSPTDRPDTHLDSLLH